MIVIQWERIFIIFFLVYSSSFNNFINIGKINLKYFLFEIYLISNLIELFLLNTSFNGSGSLPKSKVFKAISYKKNINESFYEEILVNGYFMQIKFCKSCSIWRPPRASHCSVCDSCNMQFDHHCPWLGKCISLKNYRIFFLFLSLLTFFIMSILSIFFINSKKTYFMNNQYSFKLFCIELNPKSVYSKVVNTFFITSYILVLIFIISLIIFHLYLGFSGKTTSELLKFPSKNFWKWDIRKEFSRKFYELYNIGLCDKNYLKKKKILFEIPKI
ncbi:hypothetical protein (nucleomorph) [Guillardia theta]|uniref:Palmitoyltransferase n=1 Tax=Guillardia theta TaxID=55529 RepID=Q98S01_GUITH|nr:hypothetical protein GTHECHR3133 [Guillardia theta]AAK39777.1 hypothetical protein [Guillardia theta]